MTICQSRSAIARIGSIPTGITYKYLNPPNADCYENNFLYNTTFYLIYKQTPATYEVMNKFFMWNVIKQANIKLSEVKNIFSVFLLSQSMILF